MAAQMAASKTKRKEGTTRKSGVMPSAGTTRTHSRWHHKRLSSDCSFQPPPSTVQATVTKSASPSPLARFRFLQKGGSDAPVISGKASPVIIRGLGQRDSSTKSTNTTLTATFSDDASSERSSAEVVHTPPRCLPESSPLRHLRIHHKTFGTRGRRRTPQSQQQHQQQPRRVRSQDASALSSKHHRRGRSRVRSPAPSRRGINGRVASADGRRDAVGIGGRRGTMSMDLTYHCRRRCYSHDDRAGDLSELAAAATASAAEAAADAGMVQYPPEGTLITPPSSPPRVQRTSNVAQFNGSNRKLESGKQHEPDSAFQVSGFGEQKFALHPQPLSSTYWTGIEAKSFRVRGKSYVVDGMKQPADDSIFRLVAVDLIQVDAPLTDSGASSHPLERVQEARRQHGLPPFVFIVNVAVPGPPHYHLLMYYVVDDLREIDGSSGSPFSRLARQFFFGESDEFRNDTFKLLPRIAEGNFLVKHAVGSKPAIVGKKLRQVFVRSSRHMEVVIDVASNGVATKVVKLSCGYAKSLVVDMAFILEGRDESLLPEKVLGTVRLKNIDFKASRKVSARV